MTGQPPQTTVHEVLNRARLLPHVVLGDAAADSRLSTVDSRYRQAQRG
jgi:hypothetical protein